MDTNKNFPTPHHRHGNDCHHPALAKQFVSGLPTGSYVCKNCGRPLSAILRPRNR